MSSTISIKALIIEDVEADALLLVRALKRGGLDISYQLVQTREQLSDALGKGPWDIVYSDYTMPGFNGIEALGTVRAQDGDVPFIFVSGTIGEDRAVEAVKAGANDYVLKDNLTRLPIATERVIAEAVVRRENRLAKEHIDQLINVDSLTSLASRSLFLRSLHDALEACQAKGEKVGVIFLNIDRFRKVNDGMGMKAGDELVCQLAQRLLGAVPDSDLVARLYADQFGIIACCVHDEGELNDLAERIIACFRKSFTINRYTQNVSGSLGMVLAPDDGEELQTLLNNLVLAQDLAKQSKGTAAKRYTPTLREQYEKRLYLEAELEAAIRNGEFVMHYQPQVDIHDGRITGMEALVRWKHPEHGFISPVEFIPLAEETGLVLELGELTCRLVCRQIQEWKRRGLPMVPVAINVSSQQFQQPGFVAMLSDMLMSHDVEPERIELEITETALMSDPEFAKQTMHELRRLGLRIAMDDFGTGYSSMSYLDQFPIDVLKIDRSFISDLPASPAKIAIVTAIIAMTGKLGVRVIAEGIETIEQLTFLRELGCQCGQGYYFHRPAAFDDVFPVLVKSVLPV